DAAGSTYLWTEFLSTASPEWKAGPGRGMKVKWPLGLSAKGDEGVVGLVENTWDSIGYVEVTYALKERLPHGNVQNLAGVFAKADPKGITAAAASLHSVGADLRLSIANAPGHDAYPISSFTWLLVPARQKDPAKQKAITALLRWMLTEGQNSVEDLSYARLPAAVVKSELARLDKLN
ncbi:MAG: substrate-binding domain-containing protein, partial [Bryobacteraceae bacterium]|nr:substrate-binding domain-containing protein [Bryobacteraceae bacterium]